MTLPDLTPEQIRAIALAAGCTEDDDGALVSALVTGAVAARDAQWQAAVDAAVMQERESTAEYFDGLYTDGCPGINISKAIRARTKEKT